MTLRARFLLLLGAALFGAAVLAACENSILRNAVEAGVETALEAPPGPTPTVQQP